MRSFDPFSLSAQTIAQNVNNGTWRVEDIAEYYLRRVSDIQSVFNSHVGWDRDIAKNELEKQIDFIRAARLAQKHLPLAGVPVAIKDNIMVEGQLVTCGSRLLQGHRAAYDATVIQRLKQAGALILGRTNMDEFGMGSTNEFSVYGPVLNPWNRHHVSGGSSGGSAVAVAADFAPVALGSDTGGSIRQPASFCGIWGLKPSYGRVSRYGLVAYASSLDQIGPMARSSADLALVLSVIGGHDPRDSSSHRHPEGHFPESLSKGPKSLQGQRIAIIKEFMKDGLVAEVREAFLSALEEYKSLGAEIVECSLPEIDLAIPTYYILATAEASSNLARFDGVRYGQRTQKTGVNLRELYMLSRAEGFGREVKQRIMLGTYVLSAGYYEAYYAKANRMRELLKRSINNIFAQGVSLIASPAAPSTAFELGQKTQDSLSMYLSDVYTIAANLAGIPALSHPIGLDSKGLPIGIQLMAPAFQEENLLRSASVYEQHSQWNERNRPRF